MSDNPQSKKLDEAVQYVRGVIDSVDVTTRSTIASALMDAYLAGWADADKEFIKATDRLLRDVFDAGREHAKSGE